MSTYNKQFLVRTGVNLPVGTTTTAPLTFQPGVNLTSLVTGSVEWDGYNLYVSENSTDSTSSSNLSAVSRRTVAYIDSTMLSRTASGITASGTTQSGATPITTDHAIISTASGTDPNFNGVQLPPAIPGRMIRIINAAANTVKIYPLPTVSLTSVSWSGSTNIITVNSTTGVYPGMPLSLTGGTGGGTLTSDTTVAAILSSTTILVDKYTNGSISSGSITAGVDTNINIGANNAPYTMGASSGIEFVASDNNTWYTVALSNNLSSSNSVLGNDFAAGEVVYATGPSSFDGIPAEAIGKVLSTNGTGTAPTYTKVHLDATSDAGYLASQVTGILPVGNGGTGTAGTALQAATTPTLTYDIVTAANVTTVNLATSADTISIGKTTTSTTTVNNNLTVTGNLTVNGSTVTVNSTVTTLDDPIITLGGDTAPSSDDGKDRGVEFRWHTGSAAKVGFLGWDDSAQQFVFLSDATNTSEVFAATGISDNYLGIAPAASGNNVVIGTFGSTDTDVSLDITPKGAGDVNVNADTLRVGDSNAAATITTNGTGNLTLSTNAGTNSGTVVINAGTNGNIVLTPNGTGDVYVDADTLRVGDSNATATVTSNGTGDLVLSTNSGSNSGTITIANGTNANITLAPNGTGDVYVDADTLRVGDAGAAASITSNGAGALTVTTGGTADLTLSTNTGTNSGTITIANGVNGNITLATNGTGDVYVDADTLRVGDSGAAATITSNGTGDLTLSTNSGTNSGTITITNGVNGNITLTPNGTGDVNVDADTLRVGDNGATATVTSNGTGNLVLSTNSGTNSGTITIANGVDANITIAPNGAGDVYVDADTLRVGDSGAASTITSNGAGALTVTTGGAANLTLSTNSGTNSGTITIANGANGNITLAPNGTGDVYANADTFRVGDGDANATITSNGAYDLILNTNSGTNSASIAIQDGTSGDIVLTASTSGYAKLAVTPPQTVTGTELITAEWVINRTTAIDTLTLELTSTTANQLIDSGFNWGVHRSAKYILQVTQNGASATRSQTTEILVTHDAPFATISGASSSSTTVTVASTAGLYVGMTVEVISGTGTFQASTTITAITLNTSFTVSATPSVALSSATIKAYLSGNYVSAAGATSSSTTITVGSTAKLYPGMSVSVTAGTGTFAANTYVVSITNGTTFVVNQAPSVALSGGSTVITGAPNVYVTEYAVLETNGTAALINPDVNSTNVILNASPQTWVAGIGTTINIGTVAKTIFKGERQLIELR